MDISRIIFISNHSANSEIVQGILRRDGNISIMPFLSVEDAAAFINSKSPPMHSENSVDMIILDHSVSYCDSLASIAIIYSNVNMQRIPILVITPYEHPQQLEAVSIAGAADFVGYPVNPAELMARVYKALQLKNEADQCMEREEQLARLLNVERLQNAALQTLAYGIFIMDQALVITWTNPALAGIIGIPGEQIIGRHISDLPVIAEFAAWDNSFWFSLQPNATWRRDLAISNHEGREIIAETTVIAVADTQGWVTNYIVSLNNVTQRETARLEMANDLNMAHQLQMISLSEDMEAAGFTARGMYFPAQILGGDLYFWEEISDGLYGVILLDMVGHGVSSAILSIYTRAIIPGSMRRYRSPAEIIRHLDRVISEVNETGQFDIYYYCTAILAVMDFRSKQLHYVNAGHPPGLALSHDGSIYELSEGCLPIGMIGEREINQGCLEIHNINQLIIFSDGLYDVFSAVTRPEFFQYVKGLSGVGHKDRPSLFDVVETEVSRRQHLEDDVSLIQVKFK